MQLVFSPPPSSAPGFLRRTRQALAFVEAIQSNNLTAEGVDNLVGFLSAFIVGVDPEEAKNLLLDASMDQFMEMLSAVTGKDDPVKKNKPASDFGSRAGEKRRPNRSS